MIQSNQFLTHKVINNEKLIASVTSKYSWTKKWKINVSVGLTGLILELMGEIEDIVDPDSEINFLRIVESNIDGEIYPKELVVFIDLSVKSEGKDSAIKYAIRDVVKKSKKVCHICGDFLTVMEITDDLKKHPVFSTHMLEGSWFNCMSICNKCFGLEGYGNKDDDENSHNHDGDKNDCSEAMDIGKANDEKLSNKEEQNSVDFEDFVKVQVFKQIDVDKLEKIHQDSVKDHSRRIKSLVKRMRSVSSEKRLTQINEEWLLLCDRLYSRFPNFVGVIDFLKNQFSLLDVGDKALRIPPLLLVGEAGVGKTEFMMTIAENLKTDVKILDISNAQTGSELTGSESYWGNTQTGMLFNTLVFGDVANPIILLDEIDKARRDDVYNPLSALHMLLEKRQASRFYDLSVPDVLIDASHVLWIATANDLAKIEQPIVDRFAIFEVDSPAEHQMHAIILNQYERFLAQHPSGSFFESDLSEDVVLELCKYRPREVRKVLENAFGKAAYQKRSFLNVDDVKAGSSILKSSKRGIGFLCAEI